MGLAGPAGAAVLEEITVTAQKREESLQDVPIAVSVISGDRIRENGVARFEDLSPSIPNFSYAEAVSGADNMFVRGVGSGLNFGFEMAVGQVVDGYFYGRSRFGRATFLDLERIEILKGPQGAILGKNTSAGALNITTAAPTDQFKAAIMPTYEFEADEGYSIEGFISGPLSNTLRARLALRIDDRDGWVSNVSNGADQQEREDSTARVKLLWEPSDKFDATMWYQHGELNRKGRTRQLSICGDALQSFDPDGPGPAPAGALFDQLVTAGEDCEANFSRNVLNVRNAADFGETFDTEFDLAGLTMNWRVGDLTITSLTGIAEYDAFDEIDVDATVAELAGASVVEDFEQISQELRITSPAGETIEYIAGLYYLSTEQRVDFFRHFAALPPPLTPASNLIRTNQDSDTIAVFGQLTYHFNAQWAGTVSVRYTDEEKDALQTQYPTDLYADTQTVLIPPAGPAAGQHDLERTRSEDNWSPEVTLNWTPDQYTLWYGSIRRGFKGGGFDFQLDAPQASAGERFEYEDEEVTSFELGLKKTFADGAARFNAALFHSEFDDLQVSTLDSVSVTFNVGNAASAETQGLEADFSYAANDHVSLFVSLALLDSSYDRFPDAPCTFVQNPAGGPGCTQDLSGEELPFAPDIAATVSINIDTPIGMSHDLTTFLELAYVDKHALVLDLDPNTFQGSNTKLNARVTLGDTDGKWNVSLIGKNLTDETTSNFANDALGGPFMGGSYFRMVDPPRSVALQATLRY